MRKHLELSGLSSDQLELINGSLLGDGCIEHSKNKNHTWRFVKNQSIFDNDEVDKKQYMDWHFKMLLPHSTRLARAWHNSKPVMTSNGLTNIYAECSSEYYSFTTHRHPIWTELGKKWYVNNDGVLVLRNNRVIKIVPRDLRLTSLSVCVWFMDDGSLDAKRGNAIFCTQSFSDEDNEFLIQRLREDCGIESKLGHKDKHPILYVGAAHHKKLIELIEPHIAWDCFKYKINKSYDKTRRFGETHGMSKLTDKQVEELIVMKVNGLSIKEMAFNCGVSESNISMIFTGKRWRHKIPPELISCPVKRKRLTNIEISEVKVMLSQGVYQKDIAKEYGVDQSTISKLSRKVI